MAKKIELRTIDGTEHKQCTGCKEWKPLTSDFFGSHKDSFRGFNPKCKPCIAARSSNARKENPEYQKEYRKTHREEFREYNKRYAARNPEFIKAKRESFKETNPNYFKNYYEKNKPRIFAHWLDFRRHNLIANLKSRVRIQINSALKRTKGIKAGRSLDLLGCTYQQLWNWLESQFTSGMSREKLISGEIHVDHTIPCAAFDLTKPEERRKCFCYTNLQPLWARDNIVKSDMMPEEWAVHPQNPKNRVAEEILHV